jgi:hypothetical protein
MVQRLIRPLLRSCEACAARLLGRHEDLHLWERERQEAQLLQEPAPRGQGIRRRLGKPLVVDAASTGVTEKENREGRIDQQDIFHRVVFFLAAITCGLLSSVLGADNAPLGAVMGQRGGPGVAAGSVPAGFGSSTSGATRGPVSVSETPRRCAKTVRERAGASPRVRKAASSAGKST